MESRPKKLLDQVHDAIRVTYYSRAIKADWLFSSIILWCPPGTGKTTLAMVIANHTRSHFETLSAVLDGKARLVEVVGQAQECRRFYNKRTILFVKGVVETLNSV